MPENVKSPENLKNHFLWVQETIGGRRCQNWCRRSFARCQKVTTVPDFSSKLSHCQFRLAKSRVIQSDVREADFPEKVKIG